MTALRRRLKKVVVREVEGEILLLDTGANLIHQLNETASFVWRRCDAAASPASHRQGTRKGVRCRRAGGSGRRDQDT